VLIPVTSNAAPAPVPRSASVPPPPHPGRTHLVAAHETLYSLSVHYYGNGSHWKDIRDANRDKLKGEQPTLSVGVELKIP